MKLRAICKSKIHRAVVTGADLHYAGSIGIDAALMRMTDIIEGEQVSVWNVNNGQRIETYAIPLPDGSGQVVVNGAAAARSNRTDTAPDVFMSSSSAARNRAAYSPTARSASGASGAAAPRSAS